jgi:outer membrane receptor protein involved in Fe transport
LSRGDFAVAGDGARTLLGGFFQIESKRFGPASLTAGARADRILDRYTPDGDVDINNTQDALSPKVGLNIEAIASEDYRVNVYASAGKSFKAPAIDQLFDQRQTPVPFPPFAISISNGELKPQRGDNFEVGAYSQLLVPDRGRAEVSVAAYRMDMRDELDFSFDEFRLINIGESRHEGIEVGAKYFDRLGVSAFANYALQSTTFRKGDNAGNFVKAVPRDLIDAGVSFVHTSGLAVGIRYSGAHRIYLDDQNTREIEPVDRVDVEVSASVAGTRIVLEVFNVLDASDFSTGFPDPAGSDARLLYPLAQRYFRLGLRYGRND